MEAFTFTEGDLLPRDSSRARRSWILLCLVAGLVILVLALLPFLIACFLLHHKQAPKTCWVHGYSPAAAQADLMWKWTQDCPGFAVSANGSTVEILESSLYFAYAYVARLEDVPSDDYFTVRLVASSSNILSFLKGPNDARAFVNMGRPYFLENGAKLHLEINAGLGHIDSAQTYWGLFKIY